MVEKKTFRQHPRHKPPRKKAAPKPPPAEPTPRPNAFRPTPEMGGQVEAMLGYGLTQEQVCALIINPDTGRGISVETLQRYFAREIEIGVARADLAVVQALHRSAVGRAAEYDQAGRVLRAEMAPSVTAQIYWTKARMGWREAEANDPNAGKTTATRGTARERLAHQLGVADDAGRPPAGDRTTH